MSSERPASAVVDSSVIVKWLVSEGEPHAEQARELLRQHAEEELVLATVEHARLEVLNALWSHRATANQLTRAAKIFSGFRLEVHPVDDDLALAASAIAAKHRLTLYDAAFAALANALDCDLITADHALAASEACRMRELGQGE